jgi:hypothetical protein
MWFNLTTPVLWLLRALQIGVAMFLCSRTEQWWAGECSFAGALVPQECTASQRTCCVLGSLVASQSHGVGQSCAQPLEILEEGSGVLIVLSSLQIRVASRPCSQLRSRDRSIVASGQILTRSARIEVLLSFFF